jgi:hypothetical protein
MHSILSQPHTSLLRANWTLARIPRLLATHGLHLITGTATSAHGSCEQRPVRHRRSVAHFFPHTRPPDTHALEVGATYLEYQWSLVNTLTAHLIFADLADGLAHRVLTAATVALSPTECLL